MTNDLVDRGVRVRIEAGKKSAGSSRNVFTLLVFSAFNRIVLLSIRFLFFQLASNTKY